jgi:hypothetical protein
MTPKSRCFHWRKGFLAVLCCLGWEIPIVGTSCIFQRVAVNGTFICLHFDEDQSLGTMHTSIKYANQAATDAQVILQTQLGQRRFIGRCFCDEATQTTHGINCWNIYCSHLKSTVLFWCYLNAPCINLEDEKNLTLLWRRYVD